MVLGVLSWVYSLLSHHRVQVSSFLSFFIPSFHSLSPFLFWLRCLHPKSNFPKPFYVPSAVTPTLSISDRKLSCRYKAVMEKGRIISWKPSSLSTWGSWVASPQSWIHRLKCETEKHCPSHPSLSGKQWWWGWLPGPPAQKKHVDGVGTDHPASLHGTHAESRANPTWLS